MGGTILVAGASRGLGLEFVRQYASDGWRVHACARNPKTSQGLQELASRHKGAVHLHPLDVTDWKAVGALALELEGESVDILLNNAGIYGSRDEALGATDPGRWLEVFAVNAIAPLKMAEAFLGHVASSRLKIAVSKDRSAAPDESAPIARCSPSHRTMLGPLSALDDSSEGACRPWGPWALDRLTPRFAVAESRSESAGCDSART